MTESKNMSILQPSLQCERACNPLPYLPVALCDLWQIPESLILGAPDLPHPHPAPTQGPSSPVHVAVAPGAPSWTFPLVGPNSWGLGGERWLRCWPFFLFRTFSVIADLCCLHGSPRAGFPLSDHTVFIVLLCNMWTVTPASQRYTFPQSANIGSAPQRVLF